ncbi:MAG: PD-(D/E)XK nuclease family protein [Candidatus Azambacteria bacterium]|nr:PD-(D/E)XK nuclease family protein [Candidatus Azambacteria bacterium]
MLNIENFLQKISEKIAQFRITLTREVAKFSKTREISTPQSDEISREVMRSKSLSPDPSLCPYCNSKEFVKRGLRKKKLETVQLYLCGACKRTFTSQFIKGRHFPMNLVIEGLNYYNLGFGLEETCNLLNQKFGVRPEASTLSNWTSQYSELCRYSRLRPFAVKMFKPEDTVETTSMAHRQIYRFRYHRAKMKILLEDYKHRNFGPLKEYLEAVSSETPHQYFQDGLRISEIKTKFDKAQMIIRSKTNYANALAKFVLQSVKENKFRHEALQRFFIANDSVTVASEVPVYIKKEDIEHMENTLGFKILDEEIRVKGQKENGEKGRVPKATSNSALDGLPRLLTGHIDLVQVRNGMIHILDYKPNAAKEKPIEQLTWYALALSRLTGLRLYEFKCGWFDDKDYFEFYPLHVVYKMKDRKKKKVRFKSGDSVEIPENNEIKVV